MDIKWLHKTTKEYLNTIADSSELKYVDINHKIPLTQVYVMLEAIKAEPSKKKESWDELPSTDQRLRSAGLNISDEQKKQGGKQPPVPLSKVLFENNHLVLLGEPGSGKTTTLNFIAMCYAKRNEKWAKERLNLQEQRIPIKVPLQAYSDALAKPDARVLPVLTRLVASYLEIDPTKAHELVENWWEADNLAVLFDGLDEAQEKRGMVMNSIRKFAESPHGKSTRIIVTSRLAGYTAQVGTFKDFIFKPLETEDDIKNFLSGWLISIEPKWKKEIKKKTEDLFKGLKNQPALELLTNNPLILSMVAQQYYKYGTIARNRAELYKSYVEDEAWSRAEKRGADNKDKEHALTTLETIAWEFQMEEAADEENALTILQREKYGLANNKLRAEELIKLVREKMGLVVFIEQKLVFSHLTFREYFVAKRLLKAWKKDKKLTWQFLRPRLYLGAWREPLLIFSSLLDNKAELIDLINRILCTNRTHEVLSYENHFLAAMLMGENGVTDPKLIKLYLNFIKHHYYDNIFRLIGTQVIPDLKHKLDSQKNRGTRRKVVRALGQIGNSQAISALIKALKDKDKIVQQISAESLGQIGNSQAVPALIEAINDKNWEVHILSIKALGQIKNSQAIPVLLKVFNDKEESWSKRTAAAAALIRIGDPKSMNIVLLELNSKNNMNLIIEAIDDSTEWNKFSNIKDQQVIVTLLQLLDKEEDVFLCKEIVRAISKIDNPKTIPTLIQILSDKNKDKRLRQEAARCLGYIREPKTIPALLQAANDGIESTADSLVFFTNPKAITALIQSLDNKNKKVRRNAAEALGKLGDPHAIPELLLALEDKDESERGTVSIILGVNGNLSVVTPLLHIIKNSNGSIPLFAAYSLAIISELNPHIETKILAELKEDVLGWNKAAALAYYLITNEWGSTPFMIKLALINRELLSSNIFTRWFKRLRARRFKRFRDSFPPVHLELKSLSKFDPLCPPPPSKWREDLKYAGYAFILMVMLGIAAIITIALNSAQGTIKGFIENWVQNQPLSVIIALFITLPLLATIIGITINTLKKKLEK